MTSRTEKTFAYCLGIAREFEARVSRMQIFVKHNVSSGNANEVILREFLASHAPGDFHVGQGFICDPTQENASSKQCDILIYNQNYYPLVYSDGPIKLVWPNSVAMVIEVKTNFGGKDIITSLENIESAKRLNDQLTGVIFAFKSASITTVLKQLQTYPKRLGTKHKPTAILLLDKGVIIHRWGLSRMRDSERDRDTNLENYAVLTAKGDKGALVVTCLLLLFFQSVGRGRGLYEADMMNMLLETIEHLAEKMPKDIHIGPQSA